MSLLKKLLILLVLVVGVILGIWFGADNTTPLQVVVLGFPMPEFPSGAWITGALLLGAVLGYVISLVSTLPLKNENLSLRRKLKRRDKELERLRKAPVTGKALTQE